MDYPILSSIPATPFSCSGLRDGLYSDPDADCQVQEFFWYWMLFLKSLILIKIASAN